MAMQSDRSSSRLSRRLLLAGASTLLAGGAAWLAMHELRLGVFALPTESDHIIDPTTIDGVPLNLLLPNLRDARVVVPDRPHDPRLVFEPGARSRMHRRRSFLVDTTSQRLRGRQEAADLARPRILLFGDSVAFGWGLSHHDSVGQCLQRDLSIRVLNAGVPALRPAPMGVWAHYLLDEIDVDLVLIVIRPRQDEIQDLVNAIAKIRQRSAAPIAMVLSPLSTFDVRGAASYGPLLAKVQAALGNVPVLEATDALRQHPADQGVELRRQDGMQRMVDVETQAVLVEVPDLPQRTAPEILQAFEDDPSLHEPFFFDGGHANKAGSLIFAQAIADFLRQQGLVPQG
ncbi:MAG: hypothetical protein GXP62_03095 [Oligoflexia bacterium]|nr:hypothetical protein [Oligoflexia bacterium]